MICFRIPAYPQHVDEDAIFRALSAWLAGITYPVRLISRSVPQDVRGIRRTIRGQLSALPPTAWQRRFLIDQKTIVDQVLLDTPLRRIEHYLVLWPPATVDPVTLQTTLQSLLQLPELERTTLPMFIDPDARPRLTYWEPGSATGSYVALCAAYDVSGSWTFASWRSLLELDLALALMIDITTMAEGKTERRLRKNAESLKGAVLDPRSNRAGKAAEEMANILQTESLHLVTYGLYLAAPTPDLLDRYEQRVQDTLGKRVRFERVPGWQDLLAPLWQGAHPNACRASLIRRNMRSKLVALQVPWFIQYPRVRTGVCVGHHVRYGFPIFHDPWGEEGNRNGSGLILGLPEVGKTFLQHVWALRYASQGVQVIVIDPLGTSVRLRDAIGVDQPGLQYVAFDTTPSINLLEPVFRDLARQADWVMRGLEIALAKADREGKLTIDPLKREAEMALNVAVRDARIYGPQGGRLASMTRETAPTLPVLVACLRDQRSEAAAKLADQIEYLLLGTRASVFGQHTSFQLDTSADVAIFNLAGADKGRLPLLCDYLFEQVNTWLRSPARQRAFRPLLLLQDEYWVVSQIPAMRERNVEAVKTYRNFTGAAWFADQDPKAFGLGVRGNRTDLEGLIAGAVGNHVIFRLKETEAKIVQEAFADRIGHLRGVDISWQERGHCLAIFGEQEALPLRVQPTPTELRYLSTDRRMEVAA